MINLENLTWICRLVQEITSNQLSLDKGYLVEARLSPLANEAGCTNLNDWVDHVRSHGNQELLKLIAESLTINETSFFRDFSPFTSLTNQVIPELIQSRQSLRQLNIWCAACSTGQEPYSMSLMLLENFPELSEWNINIIATDICRRVLKHAKHGIYSQHEINRGLPAKLLVKYFEQGADGWRISPKIRRNINFFELNLCKPWPYFPRMDIILLRNVMIYFSESTRNDIITRARERIMDDGYLLLGSSETLFFSDNKFIPVEGCTTSLYRVRARSTTTHPASCENII